MHQTSILLVEDEAIIRMMVVEMLEELGHRVIAEAGNVQDGRSLAEIEEFDLAILDINLDGQNVQPVAEAVAARGPALPVRQRLWTGGRPRAVSGKPGSRQTV